MPCKTLPDHTSCKMTPVRERRDHVAFNLAQVAPDLTEEEKADIASLALRLRIDGLVVGNTTISRPPAVLAQEHGREVRPLMSA